MNQLKHLTLALSLSICFFSCNSSKKVTDSKQTNETPEYFTSSGYVKAIITNNSNNSGCALIVKLEGSKELLDPLEINPDNYQNEQKIWFKFSSTRMMNRCEQARPVKVIDIKKRDE
ncbi:hypothetical protein ACOSP6_12770 [Tenacibaculum sp. MEBiC06402]|uniref:hypothetical protein n=1 Tax=unclassified Tenacibaculum TaxID=2635139 RepID=UPI003B9ABC15